MILQDDDELRESSYVRVPMSEGDRLMLEEIELKNAKKKEEGNEPVFHWRIVSVS